MYFRRCEKLSSIEIPDSVTVIECGAFESCKELENVKFGTGLTYLGGSAFGYCEKLKEVTLVEALQTMEQGVFYQCTSLEKVTIERTTPAELLTYWKDSYSDIGYICDDNGNREETDIVFIGAKFVTNQMKGIIIPRGTLAAYRKAWPEWAAYFKEAGGNSSGSGGGSGSSSSERSSTHTSCPSYVVTGNWKQQSDGSQGAMCTGWHWIDSDGDGIAECYFLNPVSEGTKGRLFQNSVTPDGYEVNEKGQWVTAGAVQTKMLSEQ